MPRTKGSRNKPKTPEPVPFNYEADDSDAVYENMMRGVPIEAARPVNYSVPYNTTPEQPMQFTDYSTQRLPPLVNGKLDQLFLIEGRVRMDAIGNPEPIFSDQKRLVWAENFDDAVRKFSVYFASLSNNGQRYVVVAAGGTEALS